VSVKNILCKDFHEKKINQQGLEIAEDEDFASIFFELMQFNNL
jgi:hypothetical protein